MVLWIVVRILVLWRLVTHKLSPISIVCPCFTADALDRGFFLGALAIRIGSYHSVDYHPVDYHSVNRGSILLVMFTPCSHGSNNIISNRGNAIEFGLFRLLSQLIRHINSEGLHFHT